jgi:NADP-dependent 3-hydroxy acid dehydrogenase YdfG
MTKLSGKICVVTGASKGLGRTATEALVAEGARVAMLARSENELREAAGPLGDSVLPIRCDVSDAASVNAAFAEAVRHFGRIDALVSNAASMVISRIEDASDSQILQQINVNIAGAIFCARAAIPHLRAAGGGDILFIGSESARTAFPYLAMYSATKSAVEQLAHGLREELRNQRTRVTAVRLGRTEGSSLRQANDESIVRDFIADMTTGGYLSQTGEAMERTSVAQLLIALLSLPPDINIDLVVPRGRTAADRT